MREIEKINESTYRIEDDYVRFFLLIGQEKAALIDSGTNCPEAREIAEGLTDLPLLLINTHGDGDHISGTRAFNEIYMHERDYFKCDIPGKFPSTALVKIKDGQQISLGGRTLEVIEIPGHTVGSVAILDVENRLLFAGDSVQSGVVFLFGPHRAPDLYEDALQKLIGLKNRYDTVVASHDAPLLSADYVQKVLDAFRDVKAGKIGYTEIGLHGQMVKNYQGEACSFFCE